MVWLSYRAFLLLSEVFFCCQAFNQWRVNVFLVRDQDKTPWQADTHKRIPSHNRHKRNTDTSSIRITLEDGLRTGLSLHLRPKPHPVTQSTIVEWFHEDGLYSISRGLDTKNCWYAGSVDNMPGSAVSLGICAGLSGFIRTDNATLLVEPDLGNSTSNGIPHIIYPLLIPGQANHNLTGDEDFGILSKRRARSIRFNQIDYDEYGNEITDTINPEEIDNYLGADEDEDDNDISNQIESEGDDDDVIISDTYVELEDYDIHPPPQITEAKSPQDILDVSSGNETVGNEVSNGLDVDGFPVDKLWEGEPQAVKRKKPVIKSPFGEEPMKYLEMALAVDHTVIKFHGKQRVQQYVLTLLNIMSAIYEDTSLEANLRIVISRLIFYEDRKQGQVREGNSKRSLENVNAWNAGLLRNAAADFPHDIAVWLTRYDLGGPSGYAPVAGVCDPDRSCSLNRDEGLTSAFIIAHEVGHVLALFYRNPELGYVGFSHDGDSAAGNDCADEALQGSVMAPMVAATFNRFHWSRCTHWEYHFKQHNWKCLRNQPNVDNTTLIQPEIQYSYSLDEQCRMEFGEGYQLCRSLSLNDPCTHLWCGHRSSPQLCKTKKGPPLEGTPCGQDKWCIKGFCESIGKRKKNVGPVVKNPRDGSWSDWSEWDSCSRTCGVGVRFRTRQCNNPSPANGGKPCPGKGEEFELCNTEACSHWSDFRAEQCAFLPILFPMNASSGLLAWFPWEAGNETSRCRLTCIASETGEVFQSTDNVVDGTPCSYEDPHGICIQGQCHVIGCDKRLGSAAKENECGVCNGKVGDCTVASRHYSGAPRPPHRRVVVIPRGARNIRIREDPNSKNRLGLKVRNGGAWVLNGTFPTSEVSTIHFITSGTRFTYNSAHGLETLTAKGPLLSDLTLMIIPGSIREQANVTVTWSMPPKNHRKKNPGPDGDVGHKNDVYWDLAGWSLCSRTCGEGTQSQVWYCRNRKTNQIIKRRLCSHLGEPLILTRPCNTFSCDFRWVTGPWEGCSHTCGNHGIQMRMTYCVRTTMVTSSPPVNPSSAAAFLVSKTGRGYTLVPKRELMYGDFYEARRTPEVRDDDNISQDIPIPKIDAWKATTKDLKKKLAIENEVLHWNPNAIADPALCPDQLPNETQPCNRFPCPGVWVEKFWTQCSKTCGIGYQEMQYSCRGKIPKESASYENNSAAAYVVETLINEAEALNEDAYAFSSDIRVNATALQPLSKNYTCGPKPQLRRQCSTTDCHLVTDGDCRDASKHCQLSVLQRYCALPYFRSSCCQACALASL